MRVYFPETCINDKFAVGIIKEIENSNDSWMTFLIYSCFLSALYIRNCLHQHPDYQLQHSEGMCALPPSSPSTPHMFNLRPVGIRPAGLEFGRNYFTAQHTCILYTRIFIWMAKCNSGEAAPEEKKRFDTFITHVRNGGGGALTPTHVFSFMCRRYNYLHNLIQWVLSCIVLHCTDKHL